MPRGTSSFLSNLKICAFKYKLVLATYLKNFNKRTILNLRPRGARLLYALILKAIKQNCQHNIKRNNFQWKEFVYSHLFSQWNQYSSSQGINFKHNLVGIFLEKRSLLLPLSNKIPLLQAPSSSIFYTKNPPGGSWAHFWLSFLQAT